MRQAKHSIWMEAFDKSKNISVFKVDLTSTLAQYVAMTKLIEEVNKESDFEFSLKFQDNDDSFLFLQKMNEIEV